MISILKRYWKLIAAVVLIVASFVFGFVEGKKHAPQSESKIPDALLDVKIVTDTVHYKQLTPVIQGIESYKPLGRDTINVNDTIYIPYIHKVYKSDDYKAYVSGYNAALDSIDVFPKTVYITKKIKPPRFGIGLSAGYGISRYGISPYVGIGVTYRLF